MSAACTPESTASSIAHIATKVLPEPTSPCSNLLMGDGERMSAMSSLILRFCASVRSKGRLW